MSEPKLLLTFSSNLRFVCNIESCDGCCTRFEEIELSPEDVRTLEKLGYSRFYEKKNGFFLKSPCWFLRGKLCEIHIKHGPAFKPVACRRYPFSVSFLENGWTVVDVKWACQGVGVEKGDYLTEEYVEREVVDWADKPRKGVPVGKLMPLRDEGKKMISWMEVKELYDYASQRIILSDAGLWEKIGKLVLLFRKFSEACLKNETSEKGVLNAIKPVKLEAVDLGEEGEDFWEAEMNYYTLIDDILSVGITPGTAAKRLNWNLTLATPGEQEYSRKAEYLYSLYLSQCLKETLSKPWSLRASFYWALGVLGFVDFVARCIPQDEIGEDAMRKAIAVVDFLNKGFKEFRNHAYPLYPNLGLSYLHIMLSRGSA